MNCLKYILIGLLLSGAVLKAEDGWQKLKWGMQSAQVVELYPQAKRPAKPETYEQKGVEYNSPLRLLGYDLVGKKFFVDFLFDAQGNLAGTVLGTPLAGGLQKESLDIEYRNLKELLTRKYGPPTKIEVRAGGAETCVWLAEKTEIRLNLTVSTAVKEYGLRLLYLRMRAEDLEKL